MARQKESGGIVIGAGCVNRCSFCDFPENYRPSEADMKREELRILKDIISFAKKGYSDLDISGSDPIEYSRIIPLVRYIRQMGFVNIRLSTHGRRLADKNFARELINAGVNIFRVPIYGSNAEIHDSITNSEGSFDETMEGLKNIRGISPLIRIDLNTLVMQQNKEDLFNILNLALGFRPLEFGISAMYVKYDKNYSDYVPAKDLGNYAGKIFRHVVDNNLNVAFFDMPYCVFGVYDERIIMPQPPDLGKYNQPRGLFKSHIKDLPSYRLKTKSDICGRCCLAGECDGFLANDIKKYGTGNLGPITLKSEG